MAEKKGGSSASFGGAATAGLQLKRAVVEEGLSQLTRASIEFLSKDRALKLETLVGEPMNLVIEVDEKTKRSFLGICVSVEYLGVYRGYGRYLAEVRPRLWFLTRTRECRVFQNKRVPDLVKEILGDYGFSAHLKSKLSGNYAERAFCLQYRETDFDFLSRLMEEEGIYYHFEHEGDAETMVLADSVGSHMPIPGNALLEYHGAFESFDRRLDHIFELSAAECVTTGKVTLADYNFEKPGQKLVATRAMPKGAHSQTKYENYGYPGRFRDDGGGGGDVNIGDSRARVRMEAEAVRYQGWTAVGNMRRIGVGCTFQMKNHPQTQGENDFLVTRATHYIQVDPTETTEGDVNSVLGGGLDFGSDNKDHYRCKFDIIPKNTQYRAPLVTPWPEISGIQTAFVVGKENEEIWTDQHGRVRIQFHWDREGKSDENSSVWVRCAMPWTGSGWGMIAIPRIGQEVVVQFEEGNPDRPIITGMLYNNYAKPPYSLPENQTQSGVKTNSTKGGGGFNELMFEDKKDGELVRFKAEKDYEQVVQNDATITVGLEKKKPGSMVLTVHKDLTETVKTGDHAFTVETGNQTIRIKTDKTEVIEGKSALTVTGNVTETVKTGNVTRSIDTGNETTTVKVGNYSVKTSAGKITMEAMQKIEMKVGANSIVIDQSGVTIKGIMVKIEGSATFEAKSPMTQVKGDALLILKGGMTMIN